MINIEKEYYLHSKDLYAFELENGDTIFMTKHELNSILDGEPIYETATSTYDDFYNVITSEKVYTDDTIEIIGFELL